MTAMTTTATRATQRTRIDMDVWSTTATLIVTDPAARDPAAAILTEVLTGVEAACSRFRPDSEINRILATPGPPATLSPLLNDAVGHALRIAAATEHLVDPTVAAAVIAAGYDRDFTEITCGSRRIAGHGGGDWGGAAPGAGSVTHDPRSATLTVPAGVGLDLGATAKAFAADLAAARIAALVDGGVLVGIGGDIAVAGPSPEGGWRIDIADDHRRGAGSYQTVSIVSGGLATSSTTVRRWRTAAGWRHHIIDPRTGRNPESPWRTVSVAAASCIDANAAATASIVRGPDAPAWLAGIRLPALLIDLGGRPTAVAGWPGPEAIG